MAAQRESLSQQVRSLKEQRAQLKTSVESKDGECSRKDGQLRWVHQEIASVKDELERALSHEQSLQAQIRDQITHNKENLFQCNIDANKLQKLRDD